MCGVLGFKHPWGWLVVRHLRVCVCGGEAPWEGGREGAWGGHRGPRGWGSGGWRAVGQQSLAGAACIRSLDLDCNLAMLL